MGLLAKAEEYLQHEAEMRIAAEKRAAEEQMALAAAIKARPSKVEMVKSAVNHVTAGVKTATTKLAHYATDFKAQVSTAFKKAYQPRFRQYAAMVMALGLSLQSAEPRTLNTQLELQHQLNWSITPTIEQTVKPRPAQPKFDAFVDVFTKDLNKPYFSEQDRDDLARLLYGEAGPSFADMSEIMHVIFNRVDSPLFHGSLHDVITAANQFTGYKPNQVVDPDIRKYVDWYIDVECNGRPGAEACNRYYFVTGIKGKCNKFEISPTGSQGKWVAASHKHYDEPGHYCQHAVDQANRYNRWAEVHRTQHTHTRSM